MSTITIDPPNATSDPSTGLRHYDWRGRKLPSVTTIRRIAGVPHNLVSWQLARVIERATLDLATLTAMLNRERKPRERVLEKNRIEEASRWLRGAATEERDASAALGTAVHDFAARGLAPHEVPDVVTFVKDGKPVEVDGQEVRDRLRWYRDWLLVSRAEVVLSEVQVWSPDVGYAGTLDLVCRFPDGSLWLVDLKTGQGVYPDHLLQTLAYARAAFVGRDGEVDEAATRLLRSLSGLAVLHLSDTGWDFIGLDDTDEAWAAWLGLLTFATWSANHPDAASITRFRRSSGERDIAEARVRLGGEALEVAA